jgi:hypothetical protein
MGWLGVDQPVSLITVYLGFYLAIVFLSLSIGERGGQGQSPSCQCTACKPLRLLLLPPPDVMCVSRHPTFPHCPYPT